MRKNKLSYRNSEIIEINKNRCIGCTGCAITCTKITGISVLKKIKNGKDTVIPKNKTFQNTGCINCGQCTLTCPTGAINVRDDIYKVKKAMADGKYMILIVAPSMKAVILEEFDMGIGINGEGKLAASGKALGFKKVFYTDFGADITVVEEGNEFLKKLALSENLPLFTSCCPSWVKFAENFHKEILSNISTTKSPQQILGAIIKTYFSEKLKISPKNICIVSVKPCTSKKFESEREGMGRMGYSDIDVVLTTREYGRFLKENGIDISKLEDEKADSIFGENVGMSVLFGISTGVTESVLRLVAYYMEGNIESVNNIKFKDVIGYTTIKEGEVTIGGKKLKFAVVYGGLKEMNTFINSGKYKEYSFIEVMACPGGCINGGGNPKVRKKSFVDSTKCIACGTCIDNCPVGAIEFNKNGYAETIKDACVGCTLCSNLCRTDAISMKYYYKGEELKESYIDLRKAVLRNLDNKNEKKGSFENPEINKIYDEYIGEIGGEVAHNILHTYYKDRSYELKRKK